MRNVNCKSFCNVLAWVFRFILTMRNVNIEVIDKIKQKNGGFILTMRNVNSPFTVPICPPCAVLY